MQRSATQWRRVSSNHPLFARLACPSRFEFPRDDAKRRVIRLSKTGQVYTGSDSFIHRWSICALQGCLKESLPRLSGQTRWEKLQIGAAECRNGGDRRYIAARIVGNTRDTCHRPRGLPPLPFTGRDTSFYFYFLAGVRLILFVAPCLVASFERF